MSEIAEQLRRCMRHWPAGVTVVTSRFGAQQHGMTVNSFTSVSLSPPVVTVTLANDTRTCIMLLKSGILGITILTEEQAGLSERFAGHIAEEDDRFKGLDVFSLTTGASLLVGGSAFLDCRVRAAHPLDFSTLFLLDVVSVQLSDQYRPLIYFNRGYHKLP